MWPGIISQWHLHATRTHQGYGRKFNAAHALCRFYGERTDTREPPLLRGFFRGAFPTFFHPSVLLRRRMEMPISPPERFRGAKKTRTTSPRRKSIEKTDEGRKNRPGIWHLFGKREPVSAFRPESARRLIAGNSNGADLRFDGCDTDDAFDEVWFDFFLGNLSLYDPNLVYIFLLIINF